MYKKKNKESAEPMERFIDKYEVARRRFPHLTVTLKTADALLMLEHSTSAGI